ncbi:thioredoxin family protein [Novosphingobium umbonatum]|uniref:Thioredoxin family protein n=1 Tax=Novosphingobium umbonatum TaxID=1908524 RepID=A0A437N8X5_9SPHN|nr:thioredoxin family protein [Novosphingobium umbonatum]RVU06357.1 thioredoxin family protein [Novosphingobium umbonatum]
MRLLSLALLAGASLISASPAMAAPAPHMKAASFAALPQPLPATPYNETANAQQEVAAAIARAKKNHKLVLLDLGGNWCPDCRILAATMAQPELAAFMRKHYEVVMVDVGRYTKNLDISAAYGIDRPKGVPALFVVDPKTNKLINEGRVTALSDARSMTPQALADWVAQWTK